MNGVATDPRWPTWLRDIDAVLSVTPQFVLSGNIRDRYLLPVEDRPIVDSVPEALHAMLLVAGFDTTLVFDPVDGYRVLAEAGDDAGWVAVHEATRLDLRDADPGDLRRLRDVLRSVALNPARRMAVVVDYASRILEEPGTLRGGERDLFVGALKMGHLAERRFEAEAHRKGLFNPVFWLIDREHDLPTWFTAGNPSIRAIQVPMPDLAERARAGSALLAGVPEADRAVAVEELAARTAGLGVAAVFDVVALTFDQSLQAADPDDLGDAVRTYTVGAADSPWRKGEVLKRLRSIRVDGREQTAEDFLSSRVLGQTSAVTKTTDILKRAVMGLSGAQGSRQSTRPRGVLFFAGPTGTGKTELAKTMTELIFGSPDAYIRFDMSEFSAEHAGDRLIGAPPGYVGFDAGGELTNAVRQRPYSLLLFDEVEKANPRILDKFLQILEDGRLTDGRGTTVHFSETVIVFTSNLGTYVRDLEDPRGERRLENITPGDDFTIIEQRVRGEIHRFFTEDLNRPELLNRVGDNIIIFDFIRPEVGRRIVEMQVRNVVRRVQEASGIEVEVSPAALATVEQAALADLSFGGRGIGNKIESVLVNSLGRALFDRGAKQGDRVTVTGIEVDGASARAMLA